MNSLTILGIFALHVYAFIMTVVSSWLYFAYLNADANAKHFEARVYSWESSNSQCLQHLFQCLTDRKANSMPLLEKMNDTDGHLLELKSKCLRPEHPGHVVLVQFQESNANRPLPMVWWTEVESTMSGKELKETLLQAYPHLHRAKIDCLFQGKELRPGISVFEIGAALVGKRCRSTTATTVSFEAQLSPHQQETDKAIVCHIENFTLAPLSCNLPTF